MFHPWPHSGGWGSGVSVSCGVGRRCSSDAVLLWLWCRPAQVALIRPLPWEPPYAAGVALKRKGKKKEKGIMNKDQWVKNLSLYMLYPDEMQKKVKCFNFFNPLEKESDQVLDANWHWALL